MKKRSKDKLVFNSPVTSGNGSVVRDGKGNPILSRGMPKPVAKTKAAKTGYSPNYAPSAAGAGSTGPSQRLGPRRVSAGTPGPSTRVGKRKPTSQGPSTRAIVVGTRYADEDQRTLLNAAIRKRGTKAGKSMERVVNRRAARDGGYR